MVCLKNSLFQAIPEEVSLVQHMRSFFKPNWTNGACVLVADKAEFSKIKKTMDFPLNTPLEMFREEVGLILIIGHSKKFFINKRMETFEVL